MSHGRYTFSRRSFLKGCAATGGAALLSPYARAEEAKPAGRVFHACIAPQILDEHPELIDIAAKAGVSTIWLAGFFYGYWPVPLEHVMEWRGKIQQKGLSAELINIPLGHPGDALGSKDKKLATAPPEHWKLATRPDGKQYSGTSLHEPATAENVTAMQMIQAAGAKRVFLDDDFRLAVGPGVIGGCFCDEHKKQFLDKHGYNDAQWQELLNAIKGRDPNPILWTWVEDTCDQLTGCFRAMQAAAPNVALGPMIMYLGAEKAGIRLKDYAGVPVRVGELMFDDNSFGKIKGKTNELFSALFHRRFIEPDLAYSETTAFPADKLSAANMAAKLTISTIADVRNTMYMSGITPFPVSHWDTLGPAMKKQAEFHAKLAGHTPRGPFKHYWGEHSRYSGDDNPYSLFLALGVPFEVTEKPAEDGWTFLSDADAEFALSKPISRTAYVFRPTTDNVRHQVEESLPALFAFRQGLLSKLDSYPYIENEKAAVCAWYPTARTALVWNLNETREDFSLKFGNSRRTLTLDPLDSALVSDL